MSETVMAPDRRSLTRSFRRNQNRDQREDADIHPLNDQDVISARALEVGPGRAIDERIFTNHHGVHQCGFPGRPQSVHLLCDAAMDSSMPTLHPAPGKTGEDLDTCSFGRAQSDDAVFCQITPVVKRSRIAIIAGQRNLRR